MKKLCIIAFIALFFGCSSEKSEQNSQEINDQNQSAVITKQNFTLTISNSKKIELEKTDSELKIINSNSPVLLNFVTSECLPCVAQNSNLAKIAKKYQNLQIVEIATGIENEHQAIALRDQNELLFEVAFGKDVLELIDSMKVTGYPYSVLFDSRGKVVQSYDGLVPPEMLEYDIQRAK